VDCRPHPWEKEKSVGPIACSYYVTTVCNAKCGFCDIWEGPAREKPRLLPPEQSARVIAGLKQLGVRYIDFTGGEPLLARELPHLLRSAKGMGIRTGLVSNGYLYPARSGDLAGLVDSMSFSLDSADRDRHNASRRLDCYDRVLESIQIARGMNQFVNINFSVGNDTLHEIDGMLQLARDLKVVVHVMPMFSYFGNPALQKEYVDRLRGLFGKPYISINLAALKFVEEGGNDPARPKCRAISANIAVSPDGKYLLPCYHAAVEKLPVDEDVQRQWHSDEMKRHRAMAGRYDFCKGCTIWCYMTPSFFYSLDRFLMLQAYSYAHTSAKLSLRRVHDMIERGRRQEQIRVPAVAAGAGVEEHGLIQIES
jgi:MoaA/NifB/PqqE/SkfB family radical SAM enzyme